MSHSTDKATAEKVQALIDKAVAKLGAKKENDICRYLPISSGGYIHHFTMRKMKTENPHELLALIEKFIIAPTKPKTVPPKPRAARGSRKMRGNLSFSKQDMERLLNMARLSGDKELVRKLTPREDLRTIKRKLISSIRHGRIERDLWESYVEAQTSQNQQVASQLVKAEHTVPVLNGSAT
ncbi:hypothetical protein [Estrella lausannensis]|uniref:Uncharacterized protein n=1 Tax=Estrella lausannensis TaxID=483423 RepID=A0A0H5DR18_9BACT|nr:hypothetical protein [Estrella lausannensis]CRX39032.1 Conserved hypothetical protein [Estrella lausannensis]